MADEEAPEDAKPADEGWSRRRFVKTAVIAGAAGAATATGALTLTPLSRVAGAPPKFRYVGVKVLPSSKAPRGIPLIPVRANDRGELTGTTEHLEWYRYCGRNNAPGLNAGFASDNVFRFYALPDDVKRAREAGRTIWSAALVGQAARVEHFREVGDGATALWRSEGHEATNPLPVLLVRVDPAKYDAQLASRFFADGILAVFGTCAHLCCTPTYRVSDQGYGSGHWDDITCFCHGSWYSVKDLVEYSFPPTG